MLRLLDNYLSIVKKMIPQAVAEPSIGLDIGIDSCKLVALGKRENSYVVLNWGVEPIENADVSSAIKKLLKRLNLESRTVRTAVFGKGTLIRFVEMPRMPLEDLRKSFDLEADKYFPFARDQIYTDTYILDPQGKDKQMSVLVAAAKREIIHDRIELLTNLGLSADFIGLNALAISNVFSVLPQENSSPDASPDVPQDASPPGPSPVVSALLDIGEMVSNLIIMVDGLPAFTRDIFVSGQELTRRISNALEISTQEAKNLKSHPAGRVQEILNICDSVLWNLISETKLSFDYFTTERNISISKLFLTGGTSLLEGMNDFFAKNLDVKIERWNPMASLKLAQGISAQEMNEYAGRLGVALGLALSRYDEH